MPTNKELSARVAELEAQNTQLREQLAARPATGPTTRPAPHTPSFGMCEGTRADLEQVTETTDPFTGRTVRRGDVAGEDQAGDVDEDQAAGPVDDPA